MHRIDGYGATVANKFTEGDPGAAVPATQVTDDWLNDAQEELCAVIEAAGIVLAKGTQTQLLTAILTLTASGGAMRSVAADDSIVASDRIVLIDAAAGNIDLTFLSAASASAKAIKGKRIDATANVVSLLPDGAETMEGGASIEILPGETFELVPDGVDNWLSF